MNILKGFIYGPIYLAMAVIVLLNIPWALMKQRNISNEVTELLVFPKSTLVDPMCINGVSNFVTGRRFVFAGSVDITLPISDVKAIVPSLFGNTSFLLLFKVSSDTSDIL